MTDPSQPSATSALRGGSGAGFGLAVSGAAYAALAAPLLIAALIFGAAAARSPVADDDTDEPDASTDASPPAAPKPAAAAFAPAPADRPAPSASARSGRDLLADFDRDVQFRRFKEAVADLSQLMDEDPKVVEDRSVRRNIVELSQRIMLSTGHEPDELFALITERMGTVGADILYELVTEKGGSRAAKQADDLLANPAIRGRGTPALRVAYELRNARSCEEKVAIFPRAKADGDFRTLGQLQMLNRTCGRRASSECCLHNDPRLREAIDALKAR